MVNADTLYARFGELLRQHRKRAKPRLTQEDVAKRVGLTRTSITNIEKGRQRIQLHQLYQLAESIGTTAESLLPELAVAERSKKIDRKLRNEGQRPSVSEREWIERIVQAPMPIESKE